MVSRRKNYTREFKIETVKLVTEGGASSSEVARDMGIHPNTLYKWIQQFSARPSEAFPGKGYMATSDAETIRQLMRENERLKMERDILKKAIGHLLARPEIAFPLICHLQTEFPVSLLCETLEVSRSGYYFWLRRPESPREAEDKALAEEIKEIHEGSYGEYGSPKVHEELCRRGKRHGRKRVARLMREGGLRSKTKRKFKATTNSEHGLPVAENLLNRDFNPDAPNKAWAADITYVWTREGWLYLAVVIDLFSRVVVGWSMSERMSRGLVMDAFRLAVNRRNPPPGLIHHSDRGSQYASGDFQRLLARHGAICSMSRKGDCWDNAVAESFFSVLKRGLIFHQDYRTRAQARQSIFNYIERFYNRRRIHSSLGYRTPYEVEEQFKLAA